MEPSPVPPAEWSPVKRVGFRFLCCYFLLYNFPFPLEYVPWLDAAGGLYYQLWTRFVPWVGLQLFGFQITVFPNGSGDTTFNWIQVFCCLVLAVAGTLLWSILDRKRREYGRLYPWLRVYVRFALAVSMINYGLIKVIPSQFPAPSMDRLLQPLGDASPMGLLWTFMGASAAYSIFTGASELLGGLLLTVRRTALLGALIAIGVMGNVVMLNFSYDVPVKLFSCHLLAMALFLAAPDARRLFNALVLNRPAEPHPLRPLFQRQALRYAAAALRTVFIGFVVWINIQQATANRANYSAEARAKAPLYGIWNVDEFVVDGQARPPLVTDLERWNRVIVDNPGQLAVFRMNDSRDRYNVKVDEAKKTIEMTRRFEPTWKTSVVWRRPAPDRLELEGMFDGKKIVTRLHRVEPPKFLLVTRGFHWINERPFNR